MTGGAAGIGGNIGNTSEEQGLRSCMLTPGGGANVAVPMEPWAHWGTAGAGNGAGLVVALVTLSGIPWSIVGDSALGLGGTANACNI